MLQFMGAFTVFLDAIAVMFLDEAQASLRATPSRPIAVAVCFLVALVLMAIAHVEVVQRLIPEGFRQFGTKPWAWFALLLVLWGYLLVNREIQIYRMDQLRAQNRHLNEVIENYLEPFGLVLQKLVMPRRLTAEDAAKISNHLRNYPAARFVIVYRRNDQEASDFAGDLHTALLNGNWNLDSSAVESNVGEGLTIEYVRAEGETSSPTEKRFRDALATVGLTTDGTGGVDLPHLRKPGVLMVYVGARRRDSRSMPKDWKYPRNPGIIPY